MRVFGPVLVFGVLLIATPIIAGMADVQLGGITSAVVIGFGLLLTIIAGIALTIGNLYQKTAPDEAFVRSGMGGRKVVVDGGAIVVGVIHDVVTVSLRTIRLVVERVGGHALLTHDKLRADIKAEFFVRVEADPDAILNASRSFGARMRDPDQVRSVVEDKLVSALRTVAATKTLEDLNSKRDDFLADVKQLVSEDLAPNGLTLETATISALDQTDASSLSEGNIFDAQGMRTIAEITQRQLTARNLLVRKGEEERTRQDVENRKAILTEHQGLAEAEAAQGAAVKSEQAHQSQLAAEARIAMEQAVQVAEIKRQQAEEVAEQARQQAVEVAGETRRQAQEVAKQKADKAGEVADQERVRDVAIAQEAAAKAEAAWQAAEAEAETARQKVTTVEVTETARREKDQRVIAAEGLAQEALVQKQRAADAIAYTVKKDAEGRREAAEADALAITKKAEAEASSERIRAEASKAAAIATAEGIQAKEMIPVNVDRARVEVSAQQVDVDKRRVEEVVTPELEARQASGRVAQDFELGKLRIQMELEVGKAAAEALGVALGNADMQLFGTPEDAGRMIENLSKGMGLGHLARGTMDTIPPAVLTAVAEGGKAGLAALGALSQQLNLKLPPMPAIEAESNGPGAGETAEAAGELEEVTETK